MPDNAASSLAYRAQVWSKVNARWVDGTLWSDLRHAEAECLDLAARYDAQTQVSVEVPS
jgi:hypothetical protein